MRGLVGLRVVAHADARVEEDAARAGERVVGVDEAAFGALEVVFGEGVGDGAEAQFGGGCKGFSRHDHYDGRISKFIEKGGGMMGYDEPMPFQQLVTGTASM